MTFWQYLDRNSEALTMLTIIAMCFAFGWCGNGMHITCGTNDLDTRAIDAGAK